jgi:hypothetical protein
MCFYSQTADQRLLGFFRDYARKSGPFGAAKSQKSPPFLKGGPRGIYRDCTANFLLTNMLVLVGR